jgi:hypothetical protein
MKNGKTNVLTPMWLKAKTLLNENKLEQADDMLMSLIWKLADYTMDGYPDSLKIEGVTKAVWYERAWIELEKHGLLPE